nr:unnamed protein product [Digitaria exilis]
MTVPVPPPPGQASFGKPWECEVATFTLRRSCTARATAATSSASVRGNTASAARQGCRSLKAPYELLTVQWNLPPTLHCTGLLSGGGVVDEPAAGRQTPQWRTTSSTRRADS